MHSIVQSSLHPLSVNPTKWSNTLKQFVGKLPTNCLSVFDHYLGLVKEYKVLVKEYKASFDVNANSRILFPMSFDPVINNITCKTMKVAVFYLFLSRENVTMFHFKTFLWKNLLQLGNIISRSHLR